MLDVSGLIAGSASTSLTQLRTPLYIYNIWLLILKHLDTRRRPRIDSLLFGNVHTTHTFSCKTRREGELQTCTQETGTDTDTPSSAERLYHTCIVPVFKVTKIFFRT